MSQPPDDDAQSPIGSLGAAFEFATRQREFEINQLTQRNNFFMIFQGVLIAGLIQSQGTAAAVVSFSVCLVGLVVALFQVGMAAGSKYWQVRWERAAKTTEIWLLESLKDRPRISSFLAADGLHLTADEKTTLSTINALQVRRDDQLTFDDHAITEANKKDLNIGKQNWRRQFGNWLILRKYSVSRIPIWVGLVLAFFWFFLLTFTVSIDLPWWHPGDVIRGIKLVPFKS